LYAELLLFIQEKKLYLDPKLNQQTLVNKFGTNRQYIYEAISKNGNENLRGVINRFRINETKEIVEEKMKASQPIDLIDLSARVGFNSYQTFYRAFKTITGLTPNEYLKELKQDIAIRNLTIISELTQ